MAAPAAATTARNVTNLTERTRPATTSRGAGGSASRSANGGASPASFLSNLNRARQDARPRPAAPEAKPEPSVDAPKPKKSESKPDEAESSRETSRTRGRKDSTRESDDVAIDDSTTDATDAKPADDGAVAVSDDTATDDATADDQTDDDSNGADDETDAAATVDPALLAQLAAGVNVKAVVDVNAVSVDADASLTDQEAPTAAKTIVQGVPVAGDEEATAAGPEKGTENDDDIASLVDGTIDLSQLDATDEPLTDATDFGSKLAQQAGRNREARLESDGKPEAGFAAAKTNVATLQAQPTELPDIGTLAQGSSTIGTTEDAALTIDPSLAGATLGTNGPTARAAQADARPAAVDIAPRTPTEAEFAEANHPKIVGAMSGGATATGGSMTIRLDPPHLGPMSVAINMRDGVLTATFETQNDEATRLLSHSLGQLKTSLEAQGVSVDRLQVQQAPRDQAADNNTRDEQKQNGNSGQGPTRDALSDQQQQQRQRQETLRRMWSKINGDPLDLVA